MEAVQQLHRIAANIRCDSQDRERKGAETRSPGRATKYVLIFKILPIRSNADPSSSRRMTISATVTKRSAGGYYYGRPMASSLISSHRSHADCPSQCCAAHTEDANRRCP